MASDVYLGSIYSRPNVTVEPGEIRMAAIDVIHSTKDVLILEIDMHSKYVLAETGGDVDMVPVAYLIADDRTLHTDDSLKGRATKIWMPHYTADWAITADSARYTTIITAYRRNTENRNEIWSDE